MPTAHLLVELPIDHFRLLGVSPSSETDAILRALELRLDRFPDQGFTHEALIRRAELLRLSADLLTDRPLREKYEEALLGGASGLELSSSREVAGLILLWEADSPQEAFKRACKGLQPPQAPALGSGREADLTLLAALSCRASAKYETDQRHYAAAAAFLGEGIQLLQRMGKLQDQRKILQEDLGALLPYQILDLLSRDLGDQASHNEGLQLLQDFVLKRGGLEGKKALQDLGGLEQTDFELFFQQIREFLTVQEQVDLFLLWQKKGSSDSGFLAVLALTAYGFSRRKPEKVHQAKRKLENLDLEGIDRLPMLGSLDLLLGEVELAAENFKGSSDEELKNWLQNYPGENLAAMCDYCRNWLKRDVLPGYRDVDANSIDLEAWFSDRDVQSYLEKLDREGFRSKALGNAFSFLSSISSGRAQDLGLLS